MDAATVDKIGSSIVDVIDKVCTKLQVPAEKLYAVCVKQASVYAVSCLIESAIFAAVTSILFCYSRKLFRKAVNGETSDDGMFMVFSVTLFVVGIITFITAVCLFEGFITSFLNPEYKALDIMRDLFVIKQ